MNKAVMFQEQNWVRNINFWEDVTLDFHSSHEININKKNCHPKGYVWPPQQYLKDSILYA